MWTHPPYTISRHGSYIMHKFTRKTLAVSTAAVLLLGGGAAYAYWTTTGIGDGTASTGTSTQVTVNQTSPPSNLYPGTSVALSGTFDNISSSAQYVTAVAASVDTFSLPVTPNSTPQCTRAPDIAADLGAASGR
jgi:hypothetical protein